MRSVVWGLVDYPITQPYSPTHRGIDIGMAMGTPLYAARAGYVTTAAYWGLAIKVDGTDQTDWYLHTSSVQAAHGQWVDRLWAIAHSGMTQVPGGPPPTGPHLHFEVQTGQLDVYATSLDPVPVLSGLYSGGGGTLGDTDMTPEEHGWLEAIYQRIQIMPTGNTLDPDAATLPARLDAIAAAIAALPGASGGLTAAQAGELATMAGDVATMKRLIEKDLAP